VGSQSQRSWSSAADSRTHPEPAEILSTCNATQHAAGVMLHPRVGSSTAAARQGRQRRSCAGSPCRAFDFASIPRTPSPTGKWPMWAEVASSTPECRNETKFFLDEGGRGNGTLSYWNLQQRDTWRSSASSTCSTRRSRRRSTDWTRSPLRNGHPHRSWTPSITTPRALIWQHTTSRCAAAPAAPTPASTSSCPPGSTHALRFVGS
jgi:hypothetical protein